MCTVRPDEAGYRFRLNRFVVLTALAATLSFGSQARIKSMPREELVRQADFIGIVQVLTTRKAPEALLPIEERHKHLVQRADVKVLESVKGAVPGTVLSVAFDNSLACPNVLYEPGATYLVYLRSNGDSEFMTINHEQGRRKVVNGRIRYWHRNDADGSLVSDVLTDIANLVSSLPAAGTLD